MSEEAQNLEPPSKKQKVNHPLQPDPILVAPDDFSKDMDVDGGDQGFSVSEDKCSNFVSPEELERLREFQVLDEVKCNDEDSNDEDSDSSDGKSEGLPEEEIEKMLEEDLPEDFKGVPKPKEKSYITRQKIVLEEKGVNHFEVLPLDWMVARHYSGMPIYMHRATRVCTLAKPYFLGKGNVRKHDIPISAIPCLAYRKALEEERKQKEIDKQIEEQIKSGMWKQNVDKENTNKHCDNNVNSDLGDQAKSYNKESSEKSDDSVFKFPFSCNTARKKIGEESIDVNSKCPFNRGLLTNDREINKNSQENDEAATKSISINDHSMTSENIPNIAQDKINNCNEGLEKINKNASPEDVISEVTTDIVDAVLDNANLDSTNEINLEKCNESNEIKTGSDTTTEVTTHTEVNNEVKDTAGNIEANNGDKDTNGNTEANKVPLNRQPVVLPGGIVMPPPRVETVSSSWKTQHLTPEEVNDYCKSLFKFKTVNIMHFNRWADRRKYTKARKTLQYPTLPEGTKLITIPAQPSNGPENGGKTAKRDWVMNMNGRSYLSVFHEYVRRALQKQPVYEFKQLENASTPYQATVYIGGMQYGVGRGSSKRAAKSAAARASIHILIPEMKHELDDKPEGDDQSEPDFSFFDYVGIEDPRITEFCAATCEPSPHAILRTCLLRNFGAGERHINTEMKKLEYQKIELTMKVGKHSATVVCKNKKTAKQRASQAILQALHPHVRSWGSLLRLYGSRSVKSCKEKKIEEQQITLLQDAAKHNEPNYAVLEKLRNEMKKLRERDEAVVPIGTLLVKDDLPTHSGSNLNNVDL